MMKLKLASAIKILASVTLTLSLGCTDNPFGGDDVSGGKTEISGHVDLEQNHTPENVYVWLEEFEVGTFTDENGSFELTLPTGRDVSGIYKLYFYVDNYILNYIDIPVDNGEFVYGDGSLTRDGELTEIVHLRHFLDVESSVSPQVVTRRNNINVTMTFSVDLRAKIDTATVVLTNTTPGFLSAVFFRNTDTGELFQFQGLNAQTKEKLLVGSTPIKRSMNVNFNRINLPVGKYELIPYLQLKHQVIPEALLNDIAINVYGFGPNYLKLPFKRQGGTFEIEADPGE